MTQAPLQMCGHQLTQYLVHISTSDAPKLGVEELCLGCPLAAEVAKVVQHGRPGVSWMQVKERSIISIRVY